MKKSKDKINFDEHSKRNKKNIFLNIITILCIIAILISSYNIIIWIIENNKSNKIISDIQGKTHITVEEISIEGESIKKYNYDFSELLKQNSNTVGWITVSNTNINYPIVQYSDNDFYLNHSFDNTTNSAGWIFADSNCNFNTLGKNTVIYGHNRKDKSMFGSLKNVLNDNWYSNEENYYINFSTKSESHVYRIFTSFVCNGNDVNNYIRYQFSSDEDFANYINNLKKSSSHDFKTDIKNTDSIITLYTCYGLNNQRLIVCAKLIN